MKEKKPINVEIGTRIQQAREAAGLTQERFADRTGCQARFSHRVRLCGSLPEYLAKDLHSPVDPRRSTALWRDGGTGYLRASETRVAASDGPVQPSACKEI